MADPGDDPRETTKHSREPLRGGNEANEEIARQVLMGTHPHLRRGRRLLNHLPASPRCKMCAGPFTGPGGVLMRALGKGPWPKNPKYCTACFKQLGQFKTGAEIPCSFVFADVRGSTALAERMSATAFRELMNGFFEIAVRELVEHDGIVDKFVGDEVIGIFIPAFAGEAHPARAIDGARHMVAATRELTPDAPLLVGAGVHTGVAFVGAVGGGDNLELTAMGDAVNVTARLASAAGGGEVLVSLDAARGGDLDDSNLEHRRLDLKGKSEAVEVVVLAT